MTAIRRGFCVATERFACPLNFNAAMTSYYSPFPEDRAFGATHDAYSCKWLGTSHAHPEHTSEDMQKAIRWALASAEQKELPSLTVFTLPFSERCTTSYQQFMDNSMVHNIATIPQKAIQLQMPTAWNDGKDFGAHPKHDILVFAVANPCGLDTYLDERQLCEGLQEMIVQNGVAFDFAIPQARHTPDERVYPPRGFEAANMTWPQTLSLDLAALQDVYLPQGYAQQLPRLWPRDESSIQMVAPGTRATPMAIEAVQESSGLLQAEGLL